MCLVSFSTRRKYRPLTPISSCYLPITPIKKINSLWKSNTIPPTWICIMCGPRTSSPPPTRNCLMIRPMAAASRSSHATPIGMNMNNFDWHALIHHTLAITAATLSLQRWFFNRWCRVTRQIRKGFVASVAISGTCRYIRMKKSEDFLHTPHECPIFAVRKQYNHSFSMPFKFSWRARTI